MAVLHKKKGQYAGDEVNYYVRTYYEGYQTYQLTREGKKILRKKYGLEPKDGIFIPTDIFIKMRISGYFLTKTEMGVEDEYHL